MAQYRQVFILLLIGVAFASDFSVLVFDITVSLHDERASIDSFFATAMMEVW